MKCRFCDNKLDDSVINLGLAPPSNAYLKDLNQAKKEKKFPLKLLFCENCYLLQTEDYSKPQELFTDDYAYFSSTSDFFLNLKKYSDEIIKNLI